MKIQPAQMLLQDRKLIAWYYKTNSRKEFRITYKPPTISEIRIWRKNLWKKKSKK